MKLIENIIPLTIAIVTTVLFVNVLLIPFRK
jgi:hypothetical protein